MSNESACTWVSQRLPTSPPAMGKHCAHGHYQLMRTHANLFFDSPDKNNQRHPTSLQEPGTGLSDYVTTRPLLKLRNWSIQWDHGINYASTKCGIQYLTPTAALSIYGSMDTADCMNPDPAITTNTAMCDDSITFFPLECVPISGQFHGSIFHASAYTPMTKPRATIPEHVLAMKNMN
jgi:hypothetical protein